MISLTSVIILVVVLSTFGWGRRGRRWQDPATNRRLASLEAALAERDDQIVQLEGRVAELESRLDFNERLLASRNQPALPDH